MASLCLSGMIDVRFHMPVKIECFIDFVDCISVKTDL